MMMLCAQWTKGIHMSQQIVGIGFMIHHIASYGIIQGAVIRKKIDSMLGEVMRSWGGVCDFLRKVDVTK
jgi:hypothetical protein